MAVLWFAREGIESTTGFAAYDLPLKTVVTNLGGERNFQFLSRPDRPPVTSLGHSGHAVDYRLVILELDVTEADAANWRAGFYKVAFSPVEVWERLGQPALQAGQYLRPKKAANESNRRKMKIRIKAAGMSFCLGRLLPTAAHVGIAIPLHTSFLATRSG
jgi:hypothetical protein